MTLDEQKRAVLALFDEAAGWGVPAFDARHLPRIAGALGIGMPEPVRVPPVQELEARMHEGTGVLHAAQPEEVSQLGFEPFRAASHYARAGLTPYGLDFAELLGVQPKDIRRSAVGIPIFDGFVLWHDKARSPMMLDTLVAFIDWVGSDACVVIYPPFVSPQEGSFQSYCATRQHGYSMTDHVFSRFKTKENKRKEVPNV
jgi:hypothetical protein